MQTENASDIEDDSIYSSDDNILEDDEYNNFDDDNNLDDFNYDLNTLNEDIEYLNNIESKNKKHIDKKSKLELPNLDDIEKAVDNISKEDLLAIEDLEDIEESINDEAIKVDNVDEVDNDEHLNIENIEDLEDIEDSIDDETIKIDNIDEDLEEEVDDNSIPNIDNLDNNINTVSEEDKELDYVPTLDNVLDENDEDKNILRGIDDIISDNEEDILISHGSMIDNEISKKEDDYFSSLDSFNLALNKDFLFDDDKNEFDKTHNYDSNEVIKKASEDDVFDTEDLIDSELYDPEEKRPPMPEDYKDAEEKVKDNMTSNWKNILKAIKGEKFVNKSLDEMLEWIKEKSGLNVLHSAMLTKDENGIYKISDSKNLTEDTKNKLEIDENEALFKKILSSRKTLYVSDPFSSLSLKIKFDEKDRENISHMIFIPIQDEEAQLKSFFIGLSSN